MRRTPYDSGTRSRVTVQRLDPRRVPMSSCAAGPDGSWLATIDDDWQEGRIAIWDLTTGHPRQAFGSGGCDPCVAAPDGTWLAIADIGSVLIWEVNTGSLLHRVECPVRPGQTRDILDHPAISGRMERCVVAPDARWLAYSGVGGTVVHDLPSHDDFDMTGRVRVWVGALVGVAILSGLAGYLAVVGLDKADKWASVFGLFVAGVGLGLTVYQLLRDRTEPGECPSGAGGDLTGIAPQVGHTTSIQQTADARGSAYQAGRDQTITNIELPPEALRPAGEVAAPPRLVNLPSRTQVFVGRMDELARLDAALIGAGGVVVAAVHGLGGIGKSTLAARYASTHAARYNPVWWITADSAPAVQTGLAGLAVGLQPGLAESLPLGALAQRAIAWLSAHPGWLLVLDNVTDPGGRFRCMSGRWPTVSGSWVLTIRGHGSCAAILRTPSRPAGDVLGCQALAEQRTAKIEESLSPRR